jgi:hypothetical protein
MVVVEFLPGPLPPMTMISILSKLLLLDVSKAVRAID